MSEPLLTKDAINLGGHKLPIPLVAAAAALLGVLVVLRHRQTGGSVATVGAPPVSSPASAAFGGFGFQADPSAALANLSQQLTSLQQQQTTPPASPTLQQTVTLITGFRFGDTGNEPGVQVYNAAGQLVPNVWLPKGAIERVTGPALPGGLIPIAGPAGTTEYVSRLDVAGWSPI